MEADLYKDRNKELHEAEMKKMEHAARLSFMIGSIAAFIMLIYFSTLPNVVMSEIKLGENIPMNVQIGENSSAEGSYSPIGAEPFKVKSENISFFEKEKMDVAFAKTSYNQKTAKIWFLIRGIKYAELPNVFDYYREFEKPPIESGFLYKSPDPYLKEIKNPAEPFSDSKYCNNCHIATAVKGYKNFKIEFSRSKSIINSVSIAISAGTIIFIASFIILMRSEKKTT